MSSQTEKLFVQYPNFRSSTYKYDRCVVGKSSMKCDDCRVQIISDRFLGQDFMLNVMRGSYNYPYVLIADTAGCNMRCWFCYSWHFWSKKIAEERGCKPAFASAERLADEFYCKFESMSNKKYMLDTLEQKTFLTAKEMNQSLYHIKKNYPVIRIRISGGEPVFTSQEIYRPFDSSKPVDYSLGVKYWLDFFEEFDKRVKKLKENGIINMISQDDWNFNSPWLSVMTQKPGRINIRFDTNGIAFADPAISKQLVGGIFRLHTEGKLNNSEIMIDYSFKGATPTEYAWSQNRCLPVDPSKNSYDFKLEEHPQVPGLLNLRKEIEKHTKEDPKFNDCLYLSVEKGIENGRFTRYFVNYEGTMQWNSLAKRLGIEFSPVSNEIDIASAWRWDSQIRRYMKPHSHARVLVQAGSDYCDSDIVGINQTIKFIWDHKKEPGFKVEIMPSQLIEKPRSIAKKETVEKVTAPECKPITLFTEKAKGYIFSGSPSNWETALKKSIWGLRSNHRSEWSGIKKGDPVFFYATSPVSGLIGYGAVIRTFEGKGPYWPDEIRENQVKYPYRIEFTPIALLDQKSWKPKSVRINHLGPIYFRGINPITKQELVDRLKNLHDGLQ